MGVNNNNNNKDLIIKGDGFEVVEGDDDDVPLPGFRFHPTDEELVSFYLRRKLDKKSISIELIKQIDIYKYDPWDLPRSSGMGVDKEGYFYCKRGRKYKNSIRPNRVTGFGFWKATGIDKPVYSNGGSEGNNCIIGLKKTLVYYRGSAGKGTKTDWMMHEFRIPSTIDSNTKNNSNINNIADVALQEAEIWTLCRIFKRNVSPRKHTPDLMMRSSPLASSAKRSNSTVDNKNTSRSISTNMEFINNNTHHQESYINFAASHSYNYHHQNLQKPLINNNTCSDNNQRNHHHHYQFHHLMGQFNNVPVAQQQQHQQSQHHHQVLMTEPYSNNNNNNNFWINHAVSATNYSDLFTFENWDELGSVVKFAADSPSL